MQRLDFSGAVRPLYGSLGVKGINISSDGRTYCCYASCRSFVVLLCLFLNIECCWDMSCYRPTDRQTDRPAMQQLKPDKSIYFITTYLMLCV